MATAGAADPLRLGPLRLKNAALVASLLEKQARSQQCPHAHVYSHATPP